MLKVHWFSKFFPFIWPLQKLKEVTVSFTWGWIRIKWASLYPQNNKISVFFFNVILLSSWRLWISKVSLFKRSKDCRIFSSTKVFKSSYSWKYARGGSCHGGTSLRGTHQVNFTLIHPVQNTLCSLWSLGTSCIFFFYNFLCIWSLFWWLLNGRRWLGINLNTSFGFMLSSWVGPVKIPHIMDVWTGSEFNQGYYLSRWDQVCLASILCWQFFVILYFRWHNLDPLWGLPF